jgi:D-lactate dehydrogenase
MKIAFFDTHRFEREIFERVNGDFRHSITFLEPRLSVQTAQLAAGYSAVCAFANDRMDPPALEILAKEGVKLIALRSAGYNHVDLKKAGELGIKVVRVPAYSPYSVAEHAVGLMLALNRKVHRAHLRVREGNFSLEGLMGFDLHGKTVGIIGTGKIGTAAAHILKGFGCVILAHDIVPNPELKGIVNYVSLPELYKQCRIITLHVPLTANTRHIIDDKALSQMQTGVMLINTGRGALIETKALIASLKSGHIGAAGLDVYEEEENVFFRDLSEQVLQDDQLARLLTFPNVLVTSHQGFLTQEAVQNIATTTLQNVADFEAGRPLVNQVSLA